jgi:hypothetical protein
VGETKTSGRRSTGPAAPVDVPAISVTLARLRKRGVAVFVGIASVLGAVLALVVTSDETEPQTSPGPTLTHRQIPVGLWDVANTPILDDDDLFAVRFVLDDATHVYRFISGFNLEGVYIDETGAPAPDAIRTSVEDKREENEGYPPPPGNLPPGWTTGDGRPGYAHGDGGVIRARLVTINPDGTPDLDNVLAEERVNAVQRYRESQEAFGVDRNTGLLYFNMGGVELEAGRLYAVVYSNEADDPVQDCFSINSPVTRESVAGPNAQNNLDPQMPGAMAGLDPREAVTWSTNGGDDWVWGWRVGEGDRYGNYTASRTEDAGPPLPWYGWQESPDRLPASNQPYYAYGEDGSFTLVASNVPHATTLTEAGGYAPSESEVGVVTVRNVTTGESGSTEPLGEGLVWGTLDHPVSVDVGDTYEISNTGTVALAKADEFIRATFHVGQGDWPFTTEGSGADRAELFALPHPWFVSIR